MENLLPFDIAEKYDVFLAKQSENEIFLFSKYEEISNEKRIFFEKYFSKKVKFIYDKKINFDKEFGLTYSIVESEDQEKENIYSILNSSIEDFFTYMIKKSIEIYSSDIHISNELDSYNIKFRIDGMLKTWINLSLSQGEALIRIIKIRSKLPISKTVSPLEGRFDYEYEEEKVDFRVSILPTVTGEKISIRILGNIRDIYDFEDIGMDEDEINLLKKNIDKKSGFVIITGPTGSGKSTTLFTILHYLNDGKKNIISIEDPVEYIIPGVTQLAISKEKKISFEDIIRFILRQDPQIINIGEIRDEITAKTAFDASATGHLVFSTLHTKSAVDTIERLYDLGVENFILSQNLSLIISQRLIRKLCPHCKEECKITKEEMKYYNLSENGKYFRSKGCKDCYFTGYKDRISVFETLEIDDEVREMVKKSDINSLKKKFITIGEKLLKKVELGETSLEEAKRFIR